MSLALLGEERTCPCVASDCSHYWKAVFNLRWPFLVFIVKLAVQPTLNWSFCVRAEERAVTWGMTPLLCLLSAAGSPDTWHWDPGHLAADSLLLGVDSTAKARLFVLIWTLKKDDKCFCKENGHLWRGSHCFYNWNIKVSVPWRMLNNNFLGVDKIGIETLSSKFYKIWHGFCFNLSGC